MKVECKEKREEDPCGDFMAVFFFYHHHLKSTLIEFALQQTHQRESRRQNVPELTQPGKKQHRVYCCNTSAAPNTSWAEPCSTELASLEKLNNSLHARDHIHQFSAGHRKIHHCGRSSDVRDSLAELQRHGWLLQSTEGSARTQRPPNPETSLDASYI